MSVQKLLEKDQEQLKQKKQELNHKRQQLNEEQREELSTYDELLNILEDGIRNTETFTDLSYVLAELENETEHGIDFEDESPDNRDTVFKSNSHYRKQLTEGINNLPLSKKEVNQVIDNVDAIDGIEEDFKPEFLRRKTLVSGNLTPFTRIMDENEKTDKPQSPKKDAKIIDEDSAIDTRKHLNSRFINSEEKQEYEKWATELSHGLEIVKHMIFDTYLMKFGEHTESEANATRMDYKMVRDQFNQLPESVELPETPENLAWGLANAITEKYEEKIENYESKNKNQETKQPENSLTEIVEQEIYDTSILDQDYNNHQEQVIKSVAELETRSNVSKRDLEDAYNWAWTDYQGLETPDLEQEDRSRLKDVKTSFEKYLRDDNSKLESEEYRRDKPEIMDILAAGKKVAREGKKKKVIER